MYNLRNSVGLAAVVSAATMAPIETGRIYGYENIRRFLQKRKPDHTYSPGSIAPLSHKHERATSRRQRQAARDLANQEARAQASYQECWQPGDRLSRRYRVVKG